jgi:amino acid transporter
LNGTKGANSVAQGAVTGETASPTSHISTTGQNQTHEGAHQLGAFLCWAVVFADIGTSVYYTPGILFSQFGSLAGLFVTLTMVVFLLLALKYAEVSVRFPEGGGVVTVSGRALNPWFGALGGMFILVDYFLTAAISSLSGLQYFQTIAPSIHDYVLPATTAVIVLLGVLNWWGIRESAAVSAVIAVAAFVSDLIIIAAVLLYVPLPTISALLGEVFRGGHLTVLTTLTGFAGAFLAFSGLESISQLSPVMKRPRRKTVSIALGLVVITVGLTSPILTIFATTLLDGRHAALLTHPIAQIDPNQFISQLGAAYGGPILGVATAVTASALLIFASNTAIIGSYHVFMALAHMSFFPKQILVRDPRRDTPIISIALATLIPILILLFANGQIDLLGQLYAFGLLGAFALTCISLDVLRFKERRGGRQIAFHDEDDYVTTGSDLPVDESGDLDLDAPAAPVSAWATFKRAWSAAWPQINFGLGLLTTLLVVVAWCTNLIEKVDATIFGGGLTVVGMGIAIWHYRQEVNSGRNTILPSWVTTFAPDTVLAIIRPDTADNRRNGLVIEAALRLARGRKTLVYFLGAGPQDQPKRWQIELQAARDTAAQEAFRTASDLAARAHTPFQVFYSTGGAAASARAWRVTHSHDVLMDAELARDFGKLINPTYISYTRQDGERIAHFVILPERAAAPVPPPGPAPRANAVEPGADNARASARLDGAEPDSAESDTQGEALNPADYEYEEDEREDIRIESAAPRPASGSGTARHPVKYADIRPPEPNPAPQQPSVAGATAPTESDMEDEYPGYYWNGTDFVRKGEEDESPANNE